MPSFCIDCSGLGEAGMSRLHRNGLVVQWTCQAAADPVQTTLQCTRWNIDIGSIGPKNIGNIGENLYRQSPTSLRLSNLPKNMMCDLRFSVYMHLLDW